MYRLDYGHEEVAARFGADPRIYLTTVKKFIGDADGCVREIVTVGIRWEKNEQGQFAPAEQPGTEGGPAGPASPPRNGLPRTGTGPPQGNGRCLRCPQQHQGRAQEILDEPEGCLCRRRHCRLGQSLVVWAINDGRGAARECDRYLMGQTDLP